MIKRWAWRRQYNRRLAAAVLVGILLAGLLLYKLGSLVSGLSSAEVQMATRAVGWHGIYHHPLYLPIKLTQSVIFKLSPGHGQSLTRLSNVLIGGITMLTFSALVWLWHSLRTAILAGLLFATGAWVLHVSRLASYDVLYLWALPSLLLSHGLVQRYPKRAAAWYYAIIVNGLLLYLPGLVWLVFVNLWFLRKPIAAAWRHFNFRQNSFFALVAFIFLPLLIKDLLHAGELKLWLGLAADLASPALLARHIAAVPYHLLVRGPLYPDLWLGRAPILDVFSLVACLVGLYFYVTHLKASRTKLLAAFSLIGWVLVGLTGPVGLSLLVPLLYLVAATGIAYLLHEWLAVFPLNPLARSLGVVLISIVVGLACLYNLRAYFVAWPHDPATQATFHYRR